MFERRHIGVIADTLRFDLQDGLSKTDFRIVCEKLATMIDCHSTGFKRTMFLDRCSITPDNEKLDD